MFPSDPKWPLQPSSHGLNAGGYDYNSVVSQFKYENRIKPIQVRAIKIRIKTRATINHFALRTVSNEVARSGGHRVSGWSFGELIKYIPNMAKQSKKPKIREDMNTTAFRTLQEVLGEAEHTIHTQRHLSGFTTIPSFRPDTF
ncbi:MAG: hypothetical protein U0798_05430 [Gemmataceae bacterium]